MKDKRTEEALQRQYRKLASKLAATGPIIQGTITERVIEKQPEQKGEAGKSYGPYYQWTFKNAGKTTTVNLTAKQAKLFQKAIENNQELENHLKEMRRLSRQIFESVAVGVKRRERKKPEGTALS
ncbi:MAG: hypothetical protein B7X06_02175 [Verrucomicrobia bacterium 21-51-4]|nr:MAG: hypothetical protein B7X06_02175 [Verrucomicrobia bacterium 21-51-4]